MHIKQVGGDKNHFQENWNWKLSSLGNSKNLTVTK